MKKKLLSIALAIVMALPLGFLAGCNNEEDTGFEEDPTKTNLYVSAYIGGYGRDWFDEMANEFETIMADYVEDGKQGVKVHLDAGKTEMSGDILKTKMDSSNSDVYFCGLDLRDYVLSDMLMDVTDVYTNTMDAKYAKVYSNLGDTKTIADRLIPHFRDYALGADADANGVPSGKYYGSPCDASFYALTYDIDLFYEKGYYLDADGEFIPKVTSTFTEEMVDDAKSLGQDGIKGTYDDGLSVTFEQFKTLLARMKGDKVTPFVFSSVEGYRNGFDFSVWADFEGYNDFQCNILGTGTDNTFGEINVNTGYKLAGQQGRLAALTFGEHVVTKGYVEESSYSSLSHTDAQSMLLQSKKNAENGQGQRIAMIIDGTWWENECKDVAANLAAESSEYVTRYGVMPFPKFEAGKDGMTESSFKKADGTYENTLVTLDPQVSIVIRKNANHPELAKQFMAFFLSSTNCRRYTREAGGLRCMEYELTGDDLAEMSMYKQMLWSRYSNAVKDGTITATSASGTQFADNNKKIVEQAFGVVATGVAGSSVNNSFSYFYLNKNETAVNYYDKFKSYYTQAKYKSAFAAWYQG